MKFSRLRVLGFKSFVEPTEFIIERGLTGVVGPNGCGKSNLVEALRWVMGESSYKNMRASGMDDVIFSGSNTRPARNTAEVALFLDNSDRTAPAAYNGADEVQVSRRIEREAGSVYRINGKEARAKDVQLIFADQSTGARSPSMVGQGRIGELIQAKPQARRALLEEAAGISGLHSRRHEAELRLRAAEQNLERLDDVVGELQGQIESLRRQARQATRFKSISADIRKSEATLLHLRWSHARDQETEAKSDLATATSLVAERAARQMNAAKEQAVGANRLPELREAEAAAAAALQRLTLARQQIEDETRRVEARRDELERRSRQLQSDIAREQQILADNGEILQRLDDEERGLKDEEAVAEGRQARADADLAQAVLVLEAGEAALSHLTASRADAAARRDQTARALRDATERLQRLQRQLGEAEAEDASLAERVAALPDPAEKRAAMEAAETALGHAETGQERAEAAIAAARAKEVAARTPFQDAKAELARIETEARTLQKVLASFAGGAFAPIVDEIRVERGFETALGAALGEDLDLPLDAEAPAHWANVDIGADDPALPHGVIALSSVIRAPEQMSRRLAQIGLVDDDAQPDRLQGQLKTGQLLVSRQGAVWRWDGYRASADAPTPAAQRLAQKNRLAELESAAEAARAALGVADSHRLAAEAELNQSVTQETAAREAVRIGQRALAEAREALARAEKAAGEIINRRAVLAETRARLGEAVAEAAAARTQAEQAMAEGPDMTHLDAEHDRQAAAVAGMRAAVTEARATGDGLRRDGEARRKRLGAIDQERQSWKRRAENAQTQIAALTEREGETAGELRGLVDAPDELAARQRTLLSQLSQAEALRRAAADSLQAAENAQSGLDKAANAAIQSLSDAREQRGRAEERLTAADERRREVEARIRDTLNVAPHMVARHAELEDGAELPDIADIEKRVERLRIERERLGAVNLRAEEEQRELSERLETIISEREDIIEAIRKLRQAIQSLNREGRERLLAAFDRVDAQFRRLFTHLFGGGTAELQLVESDDPLEAGLEILARPPGKKPQTMTLLSGGEQALTAMALIFAVFLTNPAPICVLDEVDAPLDDHNVERFCNLMDEMAASTETRFVIITHNPITMARMNRLFGVTMAEQGVSQLVSVDLQTAEQLREAV